MRQWWFNLRPFCVCVFCAEMFLFTDMQKKGDMCLEINDKRSVGSHVSGEPRGLEYRWGLFRF